MILAYHAIFTTYGTWLPNDPRGSYSKEVYQQELRALGPIQYGRQDPQPPIDRLRRFWVAARGKLMFPPYFIDDATRAVVGKAFGDIVEKFDLQVAACSIMNDHVHIVIMRSGYRIEYLVNQLKGAATKELGLTRTPWTKGLWKVFLDEEPAIPAAVEYVAANPVMARMAPQQWGFVKALG
jgi:REP element-mobilizing transposase RayT